MSPRDLLPFHSAVVLIDLIGGLFIVAFVVTSVATLVRTGSVAQARRLVAEGAVTGLSFKTAGTLLKTLELHTWQQILMFASILALRVLLKQLFTWEKQWARADEKPNRGI